MEAFNKYITRTLPKYLRELPLPKDVAGFKNLNQDEWLKLVPFLAVMTALLVVILTSLFTDPAKKW